MKCRGCGRFMTKLGETESHLEPHVYQWWGCTCGVPDYPELIYDKSTRSSGESAKWNIIVINVVGLLMRTSLNLFGKWLKESCPQTHFIVTYVGVKWNLKFKAFFAWYDFWVGLYYDKKRKILYINPLPTIVLSFASDQNEWDGKRWDIAVVTKQRGEKEWISPTIHLGLS